MSITDNLGAERNEKIYIHVEGKRLQSHESDQ